MNKIKKKTNIVNFTGNLSEGEREVEGLSHLNDSRIRGIPTARCIFNTQYYFVGSWFGKSIGMRIIGGKHGLIAIPVGVVIAQNRFERSCRIVEGHR